MSLCSPPYAPDTRTKGALTKPQTSSCKSFHKTTEARSRKRQRTEPADADESPDTTHPSTPDLAAAFAQYRQRCAEAREAYAAAMKQNRQLEKAREMLERTLAVVREEAKTAVARAEESEKLLTTSYKPSWWNNTLTDPDTHERARRCARCTSVYIYVYAYL